MLRIGLAALCFLPCGFTAADTGTDPMNALRRVYAGVLLTKTFHAACDQVAPQNAGVHRAAYEGFAQNHSVARIEKFFAVTPNPVPKLAGVKQGMEKTAPAIVAHVKGRPETCSNLGQVFEGLVREKMGPPGITDLGVYFDGLLAKANLKPATPEAPAKTPSAKSGGKIETLQDVFEASIVIPGFQAICDQVVPAQAAVHKAVIDTFSARHSLPRIRAHFDGAAAEYPWIPASRQKIDGDLAKVRSAIEKKPRICSALMLVLENLIEKKGGVSDMGALFDTLLAGDAVESLPDISVGTPGENDTSSTGTAQPASPTAVEMVDGVPPQTNQVVYAETPVFHHSSLTLSGYYEDEVRYLDKATADQTGPALKLDDMTLYYVTPQAEGTTIEGVFRSSGGYVGLGIAVLKTKKLVFSRNGRYSTKSGSGVVGGIVSTGSSTAGEGSYRISGYTLELMPDNGPAQKLAFFPYNTKTFWPDSDAPDGEFGLVNVGGKVLYRDDG